VLEVPEPDADALGIEYEEALVFSLTGVVDAIALPRINAALESEMTQRRAGLVINLSGVTFIDSAAIGLLFDLVTRLRRRRQEYAIVAPSEEPIRSVLVLAGLDAVTALAETVSDALAAIDPEPSE
jgi:anti-sigma B factor antagonist